MQGACLVPYWFHDDDADHAEVSRLLSMRSHQDEVSACFVSSAAEIHLFRRTRLL